MTHEQLSSSELEAARLLLDKLGVSATDLLAAPPDRREVPTFADYVPQGRRRGRCGHSTDVWHLLEAHRRTVG